MLFHFSICPPTLLSHAATLMLLRARLPFHLLVTGGTEPEHRARAHQTAQVSKWSLTTPFIEIGRLPQASPPASAQSYTNPKVGMMMPAFGRLAS